MLNKKPEAKNYKNGTISINHDQIGLIDTPDSIIQIIDVSNEKEPLFLSGKLALENMYKKTNEYYVVSFIDLIKYQNNVIKNGDTSVEGYDLFMKLGIQDV